MGCSAGASGLCTSDGRPHRLHVAEGTSCHRKIQARRNLHGKHDFATKWKCPSPRRCSYKGKRRGEEETQEVRLDQQLPLPTVAGRTTRSIKIPPLKPIPTRARSPASCIIPPSPVTLDIPLVLFCFYRIFICILSPVLSLPPFHSKSHKVDCCIHLRARVCVCFIWLRQRWTGWTRWRRQRRRQPGAQVHAQSQWA